MKSGNGPRPSLTAVVISDNIAGDGSKATRAIRGISWVKAAQRAFEEFPEGARLVCLRALTVAAEGGKPDIAKPLHGLGSGVFEVALPFRGEAFRVVYAVQLADEVWVVHAFQKKSTQGVETPARDIGFVKSRLKALRERFR
jgi:phage-related protein